jgi:ribosomal protein S27E
MPKCPRCEGDGCIHDWRADEEVSCPNCGGDGEVSSIRGRK